jgi:hypothetical protein
MSLFHRLDFEQLLALQDVLDLNVVTNRISWTQYEREWLSLLKASGYTIDDYEEMIDCRWEDCKKLRSHNVILS